MVDAIAARLPKDDQRRVLDFVRHTLAASVALSAPRQGSRDRKRKPEVDVERLFAAVEFLADRDQQAWSPFVSAWHQGLEAFAAGRTSTPTGFPDQYTRRLEDKIDRLHSDSWASQNLAREIDEFVRRSIGRSHGDGSAILADLRDEMLNSLFEVLHIDNKTAVSYLEPLVELSRMQGTLTIATLNYDRTIENVSELYDEQCDTLIEGWLESGTLASDSSGLKLLKLHGSIDWIFEGEIGYLQHDQLPLRRLRQVDPSEKQYYAAPAVVFGEAGKLRAEGPFLELLLAWAAQLRKSIALLVVGYSFRDTHVNEIIARWFNGDPKRRIIVLDPSSLASSSDDGLAFVDYLDYMATAEQPAGGTDRRVVQVMKSAGAGLAEAIEVAVGAKG
jgi:hypothetical protein